MEEFKIEIPVIRADQSGGRITIHATVTSSHVCQLKCVDGSISYFADDSEDFFSALLILRRQFERNGVQLLCQGARRNVWPSAMARQMGQGRKAYACELRKPASSLVGIFDPAHASECVSVAEQRAFHEQWFKSLGT